MGTLVAMHYPTKLALGAADHTYVRCGSGGKAWSCWGGKTGGAFLTSGSGSTNQADKIAEPNEKAGITCYLINGVCHQSANRILFPAGILVTGARGYGVSSAIFGPYGRPRGPFGTCSAPFNQHAGVTGDLPECATQPFEMVTPEIQRSSAEQEYFRVVSAAYGQARALGIMNEAFPDAMLMDFMPQLFNHQIDYKLGGKLKEKQRGRLTDIRVSAERSRIELENQFVRHEIPPTEFVARSDLEAISFQKNAASVLEPTEYETLFDLKYGEFVVLADPEVVPKAFPQLAL